MAELAKLFEGELIGRKDKARRLRFLATRQEGLSLALEHGLTWIADRARGERGERLMLSVCVELGLMLRAGWSKEDVAEAARELGREQPSATAAVARLRDMRRGASDSTANWVMLARALERTLNGYLARHPALSWGDAVRALEFVAEECREARAAEGPPRSDDS